MEDGSVRCPPAEDGQPAQSRLCTLQDKELEMSPVIVDGHAPLMVVVRDEARISSSPAAAAHGGMRS